MVTVMKKRHVLNDCFVLFWGFFLGCGENMLDRLKEPGAQMLLRHAGKN